MRFSIRAGSAVSFSVSVGCRSSSGKVNVCWYVDFNTPWVLVSAIDVAYDKSVWDGPLSSGSSSDWKCPRSKAENRSPTPEKYPGKRGTNCAWTMERPLFPSRLTVEEHKQRRYPSSSDVSSGGRLASGSSSISHCLSGIELTTTFGT